MLDPVNEPGQAEFMLDGMNKRLYIRASRSVVRYGGTGRQGLDGGGVHVTEVGDEPSSGRGHDQHRNGLA